MNDSVKEPIEKYSDDIKGLFAELKEIIYSFNADIEERLWAKLPGYYAGERFVRLIPFKDHINVEAAAATAHSGELNGYKLTPKGMIRISSKQDIPTEILRRIFSETL